MIIRTYSELSRLQTFEERFEYLSLDGVVGVATFGVDRYLNQVFYNSQIWRDARREVIIRDHGCDLGVEGRDIMDTIFVHHMNPITIEDIKRGCEILIDPEYLISTSRQTHNAIHYGDKNRIVFLMPTRRKGDTTPWIVS